MDLKPLQESALPALRKRSDTYVLTQKVTGEKISVTVPFLKGIRQTGTPIYRGSAQLGWLGKTQTGRYVVLQAISLDDNERQKQLWSYYYLNGLAKKGLAVPVWGRTKIYENHFWVRPLIFGTSPFASLKETGSYDYVKEAEHFIKSPPSGDRHYLLRANGDILLVDLETDELAIFTAQGLLRTFMKATVERRCNLNFACA